MKTVNVLAAMIFFIIAIAHLVRVILQIPIVAGSFTIPMWPSLIIFVLLLVLGTMLLREAKK